jgi:hypothetical protein
VHGPQTSNSSPEGATDYVGHLGIALLGLGSRFSARSDGWYDALLRIDLRIL